MGCVLFPSTIFLSPDCTQPTNKKGQAMNINKFIGTHYNWEYLDASATKLLTDLVIEDKKKTDLRLLRKHVEHYGLIPRSEENLAYRIRKCWKFKLFKWKFFVMRADICVFNQHYTKSKRYAKIILTFGSKDFSLAV